MNFWRFMPRTIFLFSLFYKDDENEYKTIITFVKKNRIDGCPTLILKHWFIAQSTKGLLNRYW